MMKSLISFLFMILMTLSFTTGKEKSDVIILTNENFEHLTQASTGATTGDWLVEFYAPWCGHCKKLAPVYETIATELKGKVNVAKVDATENSELGKRFEVRGYPTILFFRQSKVYKYTGSRTVEEITRFAQSGYKASEGKPVPPPASIFSDVLRHATVIQEDFIALLETKKNVLIATFSGGLLFGLLLGCVCSCCAGRGNTGASKKSKTS